MSLLRITLMASLLMLSIVGESYASKASLRFRPDGTFTLIQFTDTQDGVNIAPKTVTGMNRILDEKKPDFVVITGDCIEGYRCNTKEEVKAAIDKVVRPMEDRKIPWAITFGNHDRENLEKQGMTADEMFDIYLSYPHNINVRSDKGIYGIGNMNILVKGSKSDKPAFGMWLLDSNAYPPGKIGGQKIEGYDWIHFSQIKWYWDRSVSLEKKYGQKIPSLMFFHIPLREYLDMLNSGKFTGEKNESPCPGVLNSGLFAAVLDRGDVAGIFVGHDHTNTFMGNWYGITLGYSGSMGYGTYGLTGKDEDRLRGARAFYIDEKDPRSFKTEYILAENLK